MCPTCFPAGFPGFPSYWEFAAFEARLQQKLAQQQLQPVPAQPIGTASMTPPEQFYHCAACGDTWAFSSPDHAWRGYFLPLAAAAQYYERLRRPSIFRPGFGWPLLLGIAAYLLWQAFH